jgi:acyl-CoA thioester hydrolase
MTDTHAFTLDFEVRDYECDLQGIVNNAVYQHYLEHARHVFLKSRGLDFAELSRNGVNLVVVRIELDYLLSLRSGDHFRVSVDLERVSRLRFGILQTIYRLPDLRPVLRGRVIATAIGPTGRPMMPPDIEQLLPAGVPG